MCADSSTNTKTDRYKQNGEKGEEKMSRVACHLSPVTITNSRLVRKDPNTQKYFEKQKSIETAKTYANINDTTGVSGSELPN